MKWDDERGRGRQGGREKEAKKERKKEIPYKEGRMEDIGARVGYTILKKKRQRLRDKHGEKHKAGNRFRDR
jgi:hypothetical protein